MLGPLSRAAVFTVATVRPGAAARDAVRALCGDLPALLRTVGFRSMDGRLSCALGFGADAWDRLFDLPRPAMLRPMPEVRGVHYAPSTPGDLLLHLRAERMDLCFELAALVMERLSGALAAVDEVHGFRYFDARDLLGFVDGTENPDDEDLAAASVLVGEEDPVFAGGSYVTVQKYVHDLTAWNALPVEDQERVIGRTKLGNVELDDQTKPPWAHNALTVIEEGGRELKILRDNMPFGNAAAGEFGTYFIGYSRTPDTIDRMMTNMFAGDPPGNYDRILDFSTALTGSSYFVPAPALLDRLAEAAEETEEPGALEIGSLKGVPQT
ncbi:Dyp-type peroxidase [Nonomuraea typhae]|uniref:Dyp-type peroxidase n=1 Tax=Nonomuraea typhae TaxID=2603600 RepID=UPI001FE8B8CB|nr:Dyp-type peroxidase [Nonomuraea typhae]